MLSKEGAGTGQDAADRFTGPNGDGSAKPATKTGTRPSTRARLLVAAYELLVKEGYQAATLQGVARRAQLSTGAIYSHFVNKQELMSAAVLDHWTHIQEEATAIRDGTGDWPDHPLVRRMARHLAAPAEPIHQLLTEVTGAVMRDQGDAASPLFGSVQLLTWGIRASIDQAKKDGAIDPTLATEALTTVLLNLYLGTITSKAWGMEQPDLEEVSRVLTALAGGLGPPSGRTTY